MKSSVSVSKKSEKKSRQTLDLEIPKIWVSVSVSNLRPRKKKSRYRSREWKPSLADLWSRSAIDVVNANAEYNLDTNHDLHAKILNECIDDLEDREVIRNFYLAHRDDADFVDETFVDGLVQGRFSFLK